MRFLNSASIDITIAYVIRFGDPNLTLCAKNMCSTTPKISLVLIDKSVALPADF